MNKILQSLTNSHLSVLAKSVSVTSTIFAIPTTLPRLNSPPVTRKIQSRTMTQKRRDIFLTDDEEKVRRLLLDAAAAGAQGGLLKDDLELRFAGGWVRDKLLGIQSNDIDVALSSVSGETFAEALKTFLEQGSDLARYGLSAEDIGRSYKVEANPEKSKHLATASMKLKGVDLDFVNLRKEVYKDETGRVPEIEFGTAKEDADRRDATINALFYNLRTQEVEDFTGGLKDLELGVIRTPLGPFKTFMDDPLRVLRLVRFASRLDFVIEDEAQNSMGDPEVLQALREKISRERVGIELEKMIKGKNARASLRLIDDLGLYDTIFTDPTTAYKSIKISTQNWSNAYDCLQQILNNDAPKSIRYHLLQTEDAQICWLLAALAPLSQVALPPTVAGVKMSLPYVGLVAQKGVKQSSRTCEIVTGAARSLEEIINFKESIANGASFAERRDVIGMAMRNWDERGGSWKLQVLYAILCNAINSEIWVADNLKFLKGWQEFLDHLEDIGVIDAPNRKRLVDGKALQKVLGVRPGKWMKDAMDVAMAWQFRNPDAIDGSGAIEEVRQKAKELQIPL